MKSALGQGFHPIEGINDDVSFVDIESETFKIVAAKRAKLVVGAQIISKEAGELIPMILLMIKKGVTVSNFANSNCVQGTRFQALCEAARTCSKAIKSG